MINRIIDFSVQHKFLVLVCAALACIGGWWSMQALPLDAMPDLSETQVIIYSRWDRSPDIIEDQVTYPIVTAMTGAPKVKDLKYSPYLVPVPLVDIPRDEYVRRVELGCSFLEGTNREALDALEAQMREAAKERQFEKAAELRDVLASLGELARAARERKFARDFAPKIDRQAEMTELQRVLQLPTLPAHVEGFDISNISGTLSVASLVCVRDGKPNKDHYRRFRIKTVAGSDYFASMAEVVGRRYARLRHQGASGSERGLRLLPA